MKLKFLALSLFAPIVVNAAVLKPAPNLAKVEVKFDQNLEKYSMGLSRVEETKLLNVNTQTLLVGWNHTINEQEVLPIHKDVSSGILIYMQPVQDQPTNFAVKVIYNTEPVVNEQNVVVASMSLPVHDFTQSKITAEGTVSLKQGEPPVCITVDGIDQPNSPFEACFSAG